MSVFLFSVSLGASCSPSACNGFGQSMCPGAAVLESKPIFPLGPKNLWFRNVARWAVEVLVVSPEGDEETRGVLAPDVRRPHAAVHGEVPHPPSPHHAHAHTHPNPPHAPHPRRPPRQVWRVRAVRPGHVGDRRLMLEHRVGAVPVRECDRPQPPIAQAG